MNSFAADKSEVDDHQELLVNDARLRIDELEASLEKTHPSDSRFIPIAYRARLLSIENRGQEVRQLLEEFAVTQEQALTDDAGRAKLYLRLGNLYSTIGDHSTAETWYRRLTVLAPNAYILLARSLLQQNRADEAVDICLQSSAQKPSAEAAAVMAQLVSRTEVSPQLRQRVQQVISSALEAHGDNVDLLLTVAVQEVTEGNQTEAIRLFRRVIEINPNNALALNNLATLLAEHPNQLKEAREYVERAMAIAGRDAALLDTLGTIFIRAGDFGQAVAALEEAVAEAPSDPRYYFHLAVAYSRSGRTSPAIEALDTSRQRGLESAILTVGDRELLASLELDLHGAPTALPD
jgi:tetratricopeptide (TPR) repeat protein